MSDKRINNDIASGLAVRSAIRCREQWFGPSTYKEIADDLGCCSWQTLYYDGRRALSKMRRGLEARGVSREEALIALEMMTRQSDSYHAQVAESEEYISYS
jgi:hypothetical protein